MLFANRKTEGKMAKKEVRTGVAVKACQKLKR